MHRHLWRIMSTIGLGSLSLWGSTACTRDLVLPPPMAVETLYWDLNVNHPAVRLSMTSPYDTVQLAAVPYTSRGERWNVESDTVSLHDTTIWISPDTSKVRVSTNGLVTAIAVTSGVNLIVSRQIGTVTHKDTIRVQVDTVTNPRILTTFRFRPTDSLKRAMSFFPIALPAAVIQDQYGESMTGLPVAYVPTNWKVLKILNKWTSSFTSQSIPGTSRIIASTYAYGVAMADTFTLEIGWSTNPFAGNPGVIQLVQPNGTTTFEFKASRLDIGPGGVVYWENASGQRPFNFTGTIKPGVTMRVVFDDTTNVLAAPINSGSGNIDSIPGDSSTTVLDRRRYRRFLVPGEYQYTIEPFAYRGVVVVHDR